MVSVATATDGTTAVTPWTARSVVPRASSSATATTPRGTTAASRSWPAAFARTGSTAPIDQVQVPPRKGSRSTTRACAAVAMPSSPACPSCPRAAVAFGPSGLRAPHPARGTGAVDRRGDGLVPTPVDGPARGARRRPARRSDETAGSGCAASAEACASRTARAAGVHSRRVGCWHRACSGPTPVSCAADRLPGPVHRRPRPSSATRRSPASGAAGSPRCRSPVAPTERRARIPPALDGRSDRARFPRLAENPCAVFQHPPPSTASH